MDFCLVWLLLASTTPIQSSLSHSSGNVDICSLTTTSGVPSLRTIWWSQLLCCGKPTCSSKIFWNWMSNFWAFGGISMLFCLACTSTICKHYPCCLTKEDLRHFKLEPTSNWLESIPCSDTSLPFMVNSMVILVKFHLIGLSVLSRCTPKT